MKKELKPSEILIRALELLGPNGRNWIKRDWRIKAGTPVFGKGPDRSKRDNLDFSYLGSRKSHKCKNDLFCSSGAINYVDTQREFEAANYLSKFMNGTILGFNDSPKRTFPEIKEAFEKAIEAAKKDGN